jgi:hypothetical protein
MLDPVTAPALRETHQPERHKRSNASYGAIGSSASSEMPKSPSASSLLAYALT